MKAIIKKPIISEKATGASEKFNRFTFAVDKKANKIEIKNASTIDGISYTLDKEITIIPEIVLEGLLVGDGTVRNKKVALCIGEKDQDYYNSEISHLIEHTGYSFFRNSFIDFPLTVNFIVPVDFC